ncbi:MAG TPA: 23S rRNA (adenine(2503)-C(2))-methyltransferase RlmN [Oligoflexia bacterium]|nr:23S rRNA (adenine(2503)-C(2))-methyltransferase RlmN [Oligoflexia bacterium]HMP27858.1 23S rRNA (adenine(2503)-C(2))-methyltransferase RlmN [Oligoflexia bacterium]
MSPVDFFSLTPVDLAHLLQDRYGEPSYRAHQLLEWVYKKGRRDFDGMTNISRELREKLQDEICFSEAKIVERKISLDGTRKYLIDLGEFVAKRTVSAGVGGRALVEAVMIKQPRRMTLCLSSQVGCGMACAFCMTGTMGFVAHLSESQIIRQLLAVAEDSRQFGDSFSNIVFMGMGEPLHNFENLKRALLILNSPYAFDIGPRKITVSTSGLLPEIKRFFDESLGANLAVSLNATDDEVRSKIMPVNKRYNLNALLELVRGLPLGKRKTITFEYVMLAGVNDREEDLNRLPELLNGLPVKLNLIPYNSNGGLGFEPPSASKVSEWQKTLSMMGIVTTVRWSKGGDIAAACGQLVSAAKRSDLVH